MFTRQSDQSLYESARAAKRALSRLNLGSRPMRYLGEVDALLDECITKLRTMLDRVDAEGVEAETARAALVEAEREANAGFADVYGALVATHNVRRLRDGGDGDYMPELQAYLDGHNPTAFRTASRPIRLRTLAKALAYSDDFVDETVVPDGLIERARQAHDRFAAALETLGEELDDLSDARNVADIERLEARRLYRAARNIATAALNLADHRRPIGDYMDALTVAVGRWSPAGTSADEASAPTVGAGAGDGV